MNRRVVGLLLDAHRARAQRPDALVHRRRTRLADLVAFARPRLPCYQHHYRALPAHLADPSPLPPPRKQALMARFDEWDSDRRVTFAAVRALLDEPHRIGERFLERVTVITTSGTTGAPGLSLVDEGAMSVTSALALDMMRSWRGGGDIVPRPRPRAAAAPGPW